MANLVDDAGSVNSNLVSGTGTNSARFTMPGNVGLNVESVVATIDNAAGGDTTATLTVRDQSGVVIATKRQDDTIPAGDTGTATFALRLDNTGGGIRFNRRNVGGYIDIETSTSGPFSTGFYIKSSQGFFVDAPGTNTVFIVNNGLYQINANSGAYVLNITGGAYTLNAANGDVTITTGPTGTVEIDGTPITLGEHLVVQDGASATVLETTSDTKLAFFGVAPVVRQATPVTLANVIALLQAYGLAV